MIMLLPSRIESLLKNWSVVSNPVYFQLSTSRPKYLLKALPVLLKIISFKREWAVSYRWITVGISVSIFQSHTEPIMPKDLTLNHLIYSLSALVYRNLFHVLALLLFSPVQRPPQGTLLYRKTDRKKENLSGMCTCVKILCRTRYRSPTKIPNRDKKTEPIDIVTRKPNLVHPLTYSHFY